MLSSPISEPIYNRTSSMSLSGSVIPTSERTLITFLTAFFVVSTASLSEPIDPEIESVREGLESYPTLDFTFEVVEEVVGNVVWPDEDPLLEVEVFTLFEDEFPLEEEVFALLAEEELDEPDELPLDEEVVVVAGAL